MVCSFTVEAFLGPLMKCRSLRLLPALLTLLLLFSCTAKPTPSVNERPLRPGPAYIQWLEEQACLRTAPELTSVVSGSSLTWRYGSRSSLLPDDARVWLRLSPALTAWSGQNSFFAALGRNGLVERLKGLGVHGLFLTGCADTGDDWAGRSPALHLGEDGTGLLFGRMAGSKEDYVRLMNTLSGAGLLVGGTLLPAHTGMGADFSLAIRAVRDYPGLYAMTDVPQDAWSLLPALKENDTSPLSAEETTALRARGALPPLLVQDGPRAFSASRGWAATGPVAGVDGVKRRWLYRWYEAPDRPVLHWDDPSGAAQRVLNASLIQQVGLNHQVLVGVSAAAWFGLDVLSPGGDDAPETSLEPGLSAVRTLARNAHRYGAAVLLLDEVPMEHLAVMQHAGVDVAFDSVLSPALERSLLKEDAEPLRRSLRRSLRLNVSHASLWRSTADGLPRPSLASLLPFMPEGWPELLLRPGAPAADLRLNAPTLAAMACGLAPGARPEGETLAAIRNAHLLQLSARAFLPGMLMLSGADLDGGLPLGKDWPGTPPLWRLDSLPSSRQGLPSGLAMYRLPGNGMEDTLEQILASRKACGIATGALADVPSCEEKNVFITVSTLPGGGSLAFFGNVSRHSATFTPDFPHWTRASSRTDALSGTAISEKTMTLPAWGWRAVLLH